MIEKDEQKCLKLKNSCTAELYCGDAFDLNIWRKINPTYKDTALLVTNSDEINLKIANFLQNEFSVYRIFARDNDPQNREVFKKNSITPLVYTEQLIKIIENAIENPTIFELISGTKKTIMEKSVNKFANKTVKQSGITSFVDIVLIKRDSEWIYPLDDFVLKKGDVVVFVVDKDSENAVEKMEF